MEEIVVKMTWTHNGLPLINTSNIAISTPTMISDGLYSSRVTIHELTSTYDEAIFQCIVNVQPFNEKDSDSLILNVTGIDPCVTIITCFML